uniref:Uncharacterized protein n=1 Tax=Pseudo-nitzschia delicatissima TaxID=44447 RepID=A0A7S0TAN1_9STRA|mmetsp:Transcript_1548/g.3589  ORF Transcript_1548/g.3589 Transcript_1548/m.3589 type:complete len:282 (+) Transcript_1548:99-944(+)
MSVSTRSILSVLVAFLVLIALTQAFVVTNTNHCSIQQHRHTEEVAVSPLVSRESVTLCAKKKRRRRKSTDASPPPAPEAEVVEAAAAAAEEPVVLGESDELPDFDLGEGGEDAEAVEKEVMRAEIDPDAITANMMGSGQRGPSKSLDELIMDRSIEERFEFEEKGDPSIPDFVDLAKASSSTPTYQPDSLANAGVGKKKARQAERIARAVAAKEAAEPEESFLAKYFPQFLNEKGEFYTIYFLEQGAWAGIFLLIGWEFYINSPLFERAAPLAPVVFEIVM